MTSSRTQSKFCGSNPGSEVMILEIIITSCRSRLSGSEYGARAVADSFEYRENAGKLEEENQETAERT